MLRRLAVYLVPYKSSVALTLLLVTLHGLFDSLGPLLTRYAVDRYFTTASTSELPFSLPANPVHGLAILSLAYLSVVILTLLSEFGMTLIMNRTGQFAMFDLRRDLMAHLHRLDIAYFDRNPVGRTVTRVTTDVDTLNELFTSGFVAILGDLLMLLWLLGILLSLSPGLTLIVLAATPLVFAATMRFRRDVAGSNRRIRTAVARINAFLQEHVNGMSVVQLFNREERSRQDFAGINRDHMEAYKDSIHAYGWFYPVVEFLGMLTLTGLLVYGGASVPAGAVSLGTVVAFLQYALRFFRPIQDLSEKYNVLQAAMAAGERIFQLLDTEPSIRPPASPRPLPADLTIAFENVWFAYNGENWVLRDVSFSIRPGENIAVVGHTGAGKTTLTNLLLRFYDVQRGHIRVGGVDIREFAPEDLRALFSIVLQDPWLFTGDIRSNITLGTRGLSEEQIRLAAARVNLLDFVDSLPNGFGEAVAERGANFSTGQKQLISFARALVHEPRILILDEATSSVDTETELRIRDAQKELLAGRTAIVIAHRLSTIQSASRILAFHKGQLQESGTHSELLQQRGIYWRLYELQYAARARQEPPGDGAYHRNFQPSS
ncbi:MAG TPA: ABC transporter ATP-binding protein [Bryobacteraceae bacterium]|nr:ABC transporter ATP-binding protein [Bryobacteraceae bacterium]